MVNIHILRVINAIAWIAQRDEDVRFANHTFAQTRREVHVVKRVASPGALATIDVFP